MAQQLRPMVQLVEILVVVTLEAIFRNGYLTYSPTKQPSAQHLCCQRLNIMSPNTHAHTHRLGRSDVVHIQPQQPGREGEGEGALLGLLGSSTSGQASVGRLNQSQLSRLMPVLDTG